MQLYVYTIICVATIRWKNYLVGLNNASQFAFACKHALRNAYIYIWRVVRLNCNETCFIFFGQNNMK